ncbi:MAG: helix-turn-helix transcriptional regulator [Parvibaculum sp.]|nr:helix-turn-helix transcriptional regulator [Parvibaculum sp.]
MRSNWTRSSGRAGLKSITWEVIAAMPAPVKTEPMLNTNQTAPVGEMLRTWRQRRRLSQLALACDAEVSARHLSFLETGRSRPSRQMLTHLAELLDIPPRDRNSLLLAAGFAPLHSETPLDNPKAADGRRAVDFLLVGHEPSPALAVDRHWTLVASNRAIGLFLEGVAPELLEPPVNVLRLSLHPKGLAPRIVNLRQWRTHALERLQKQIDASGNAALMALYTELEGYPCGPASNGRTEKNEHGYGEIIVPLRIRTDDGVLSFLTTTTVFGTAVDLTFSELAIETFFPADEFTAAALRKKAVES